MLGARHVSVKKVQQSGRVDSRPVGRCKSQILALCFLGGPG